MSRMIDFCDISCDTCYQWTPGIEPSTKAQRKVLKGEGWSLRMTPNGVQDICPVCNGADPKYWWRKNPT